MRFLLLFLCLMISAQPVSAEHISLTVELAEDHVDITTGFDGSKLTLFGIAEKGVDIAVVIHGPKQTTTVWHKGKAMGVWLNKDSMKFRDVPVYYDYALSRAADEIAEADVLKGSGIGLNSLFFDPDDDGSDAATLSSFQEALIRNKQTQSLFPLKPQAIDFLSDRFFKVTFNMPANVPTGSYQIHTYEIKNGAIEDENITRVRVAQVGAGASVFQFAHSHSFAYGALCVFLAVFAGWIGNVFYRRD